ncbi:unnamed protein product [Rotaria sp. Silwood2]|nr:unnamed protein product [Rotaria sp. Silwood2]CAF2915038.1 unnamed protein product [Rotaria sp. Silwood2]CAF3409626.1 unnamed protein product [Rotaria sp. Silwood2]CAF4434798.1 unnamed protein product [Rotaria sp. Silwood2]CAF4456134.1 unnamed protein product [Rotaria sp. Silwood2]
MPVVAPTGQGQVVHSLPYPNSLRTIRITSNQTNGLYTLMDGNIQVGEGMQLHIHTREDETFCVQEGQIQFRLNNDTFFASKGDCIFAAKQSIMAFRNKNTTGTRVLFFFTPGGIEEYFYKASPYFAQQPPNTTMTDQIAVEYGMKLLGMPIWDDSQDISSNANGSYQLNVFLLLFAFVSCYKTNINL